MKRGLLTIVLLVACGGLVAGCTMRTEEEPVDSVSAAQNGGKPCTSSADCQGFQYCTTEDGVCNDPPTCRSGEPCLAVCYGECVQDNREECGDVVCPAGMECCNASCGTCVEPGGYCTQQVCE